MAKIEILPGLADRARKLGIHLTNFCNRKVRIECERIEKAEGDEKPCSAITDK